MLGFPKIEIERKPQKNFQINFIMLMLEHKGGSTEKRKVLGTDWGWFCLAAFISWGQKWVFLKKEGFRNLLFQAGVTSFFRCSCLVTMIAPARGGKREDYSLSPPQEQGDRGFDACKVSR